VRRSATAAEIRRAYQKLARQLHPDLNPGDPVAADRFRTVSGAFEVLNDPQRRGQYDRGEQPKAPAAGPEVGFQGFDFSADVRTGPLNFREFFEGVLRPPAAASVAVPGEDLEQVRWRRSPSTRRSTVRRVASTSCASTPAADAAARGRSPSTRGRVPTAAAAARCASAAGG
jgi:curved DNA-binding protein CbpA